MWGLRPKYFVSSHLCFSHVIWYCLRGILLLYHCWGNSGIWAAEPWVFVVVLTSGIDDDATTEVTHPLVMQAAQKPKASITLRDTEEQGNYQLFTSFGCRTWILHLFKKVDQTSLRACVFSSHVSCYDLIYQGNWWCLLVFLSLNCMFSFISWESGGANFQRWTISWMCLEIGEWEWKSMCGYDEKIAEY